MFFNALIDDLFMLQSSFEQLPTVFAAYEVPALGNTHQMHFMQQLGYIDFLGL